MNNQKLYDRIMRKADIRGPDECWPILRGVNPDSGYGMVWMSKDRYLAGHRALMTAIHGKLDRWTFEHGRRYGAATVPATAADALHPRPRVHTRQYLHRDTTPQRQAAAQVQDVYAPAW
jgi:hypothetical protein